MAENDIRKLQERASKPKRVDIDGKVVELDSVSDTIELDRYIESKRAMSGRRRGFRISKMEAGGA